MNTRTTLTASALLAACVAAGSAHAALQGRDLDGNVATFEAYYDTVLDITWLADANYAKTSGYDADGLMNWTTATSWAANLSFHDAVNNITYDDWRLPTVEPVNGNAFDYSYSTNGSTDYGYNITSQQSEMAYMFYANLGNPGNYTPAGAYSGCYAVGLGSTCLDNVGPFVNLLTSAYWSATEYAPNSTSAWVFNPRVGLQAGITKTYLGAYAWAVSPGDIAAVPEAETWAMLLAGLTLVGVAVRRRRG